MAFSLRTFANLAGGIDKVAAFCRAEFTEVGPDSLDLGVKFPCEALSPQIYIHSPIKAFDNS